MWLEEIGKLFKSPNQVAINHFEYVLKEYFTKLNRKNIIFKLGNGAEGWQNKVLFDSIIISAASEIIPVKLLENLKNQGCLIMPKKKPSGNQKLLLVKNNNKTYLEKELLDVKFVPLLNKNIE